MTSDNDPTAAPFNILLYSDSDVVRAPVRAAVDKIPGLRIAFESNGTIDTMTKARRQDVDIVLLDIGARDAMRALRRLRDAIPELPVIAVGTVSFANVRASMEALLMGAVEYIPTPTQHAANADHATFKEQLTLFLTTIAKQERRTAATPVTPAGHDRRQIRLGKAGTKRPQALIVGSSTGGPKALTEVFTEIGATFPLPIFITQHMPPKFTETLAMNIGRKSGMPCTEGISGEIAQPGHIYVAPGGKHMLLERVGKDVKIHLDDGPQINFCKPAVDPMFASAAKAYDGHVLGVILTGMGQDGREGSRHVVNAGGTIITQDEESSVVWGMPGAVATAGIASEVLPLSNVARRIKEICRS